MQVVQVQCFLWEIQAIMHGEEKVRIAFDHKSHINITMKYLTDIVIHIFVSFLRSGLDSVITQMLNQMENAGPPPLSKEKIQDVPRVEISDEQVEQKLQCSVCWDNFERMETVRQLPCTVNFKFFLIFFRFLSFQFVQLQKLL